MSDSTPATAPAAPRDPSLDALKGLLLVCVVIGHFPTSQAGINPFGPLPEWVYFCHVPLFLALSCLFVAPFSLSQLGRRARPLLVPYLVWVALSHPQRLVQEPLALLRDAALGNWASLHSILWFLPALFTLNLLVSLGRRGRAWRADLALLIPGALAFLAAPALARHHARIPFGLDVAVYLLPFVAAMDQVWKRRQALAGPWRLPAALAALALGGTVIRFCERVKTHSEFARRVDFAQFSVPETWAGYLGLCLMGAALVLLASHLPCRRLLAAAGRCGMPIYLLHYPLLWALTRTIGIAGESRTWLFVYGVTVTGLVIALAMLVAQGLSRLSPRFALLGVAVSAQCRSAG